MTTDPRLAVLAGAMAIVHMTDPAFIQGAATHTREQAIEHAGEWALDAAAILAELPEAGWALLQDESHIIADQQAEIARLRAALDRLARYADAASDCPYPMHDPEKCDHRYILRKEVALARAALATAKEQP